MSDNSGGKTITKRHAAVNDSTGVVISFAKSVTQVLVHIEGAAASFNYAGTDTESSTADAQITTDGVTFTIPIGGPPNRPLGTIKAPTGTTVDVSLIAWR